MTTSVSPFRTICNYLFLVILYLLLSISVKAQTFTTIANGLWSSASTWQGGVIPDATNITAASVINIKHAIIYTGANINNYGTINIKNQTGLAPRLIVGSGVSFTNQFGGKVYINNAEYRQYRFIGGGETGTAQTGSFINAGGYFEITNSFMEVAENFINQNMGVRVINNTSVTTGKDFKLSSNSFDTLKYTSVSVGMHGAGDLSTNGGTIYFQSVRIEVASAAGLFKINGSNANGDIDFITLKNHVTNITGAGTITFSNSIVTTGINLDAYCAISVASYFPFGNIVGTQSLDCSLNYFPAKLFASVTPGTLNFSSNPVLIAGLDKQVGAQYKYEGVAPGIDAIVTIDSLVNGATITMIDDNTAGSGFIEGFQPQITSGPAAGMSYAVFSFVNKITGTSVDYKLVTFTTTALDIDGTSTLKEMDEIGMGAGATTAYMLATPQISVSQIVPGSFRGINTSGITVNGVDTTTKAHMFSVSNSNVASITIKLGMQNSVASSNLRLFSVYFKGFVYPIQSLLPAKLKSFVATLNNTGNKADIKWTTSSEINVSHFVIEKSNDGVHFSDLMVVFANGTESSETNYKVSDDIQNEKSKVVYYRLRSVDNDGNIHLSDTRLIRISNSAEKQIRILTYPNPVMNELRVTIPSTWQNRKVTFEMFSVNGQTASKIETTNSSQTERINVNNINPGVYIVRVSCEGEVLQQKIIKQ